jgi:hypothetical protein
MKTVSRLFAIVYLRKLCLAGYIYNKKILFGDKDSTPQADCQARFYYFLKKKNTTPVPRNAVPFFSRIVCRHCTPPAQAVCNGKFQSILFYLQLLIIQGN